MRRPPHRRSGRHAARSKLHRRLDAFVRTSKGRLGARSITGLLLVAGVALAGVGAGVAGAETPAQKVARLKRQAAQVQATIDQMNDQVEIVVEEFNANREALQATIADQRATERRLEEARKRLASAEGLMGDRVRAIYMGGPVTGMEQLLEVRTPTDALTVAQYQESASDADLETMNLVRQRRQELASIADTLKGQRREQEQLQSRLAGQRHEVEAKLAQQRDYLARLDADVKRAVTEERQRQEELQRQALARKLAAEKAREQAAKQAALKAHREKAAKQAALKAQREKAARQASGRHGGGSRSRRATSSSSGSSSSSAPSSAAAKAVAYAKAQLGKPYVWSTEGPNSFDCSGLTMMAWRSAGVSIPRVSRAQHGIGRHVSRSALEPGDLVFFGSPIHHVGMYVGDGMMIEAPYTGQVVRYHTIDRRDYAGATRPTG